MKDYSHLLPYARRQAFDGKGMGTVNFSVCPCCGKLEWVSSEREPTAELKVRVSEAYDNYSCVTCNYMRARFPEVAAWVTDVVGWRLEKERERQEADGAHDASTTDAGEASGTNQ